MDNNKTSLPAVRQSEDKIFDKLSSLRNRYNITLTPEEVSSLKDYYAQKSIGINANVAIICKGEDCPFKEGCWFWENKKLPLGKQCPIETELIIYHTTKLIEEFNVNENNHSELMLIQELVELLIYEMRLSYILSHPEHAMLFSSKPIFSALGDVEYEEDVHWAMKLKEKIKNRKMKILESLNATRKEKWKVERDMLKALKNKETSTDGSYSGLVIKLKKLMNDIKKFEEHMPEEAIFEEIRKSD